MPSDNVAESGSEIRMKDFLGQEYGKGDLVMYAVMRGRRINMILGRVADITMGRKYGYADFDDSEISEEDTEVKVKIQPLKASRWKQHANRVSYIDKRTGKRIGLEKHNRDGTYAHYDGGFWEHNDRAEKVMYEKALDHPEFRQRDREWGSAYPDPVPVNPESWTWVPLVLADHVQEMTEEPNPVTISVTENIVKWNGTGHERA